MTSEDQISPLPAATMAEKSILSCMMKEPGRFIAKASSEGINEDSFYTPDHRLIYSRILSYHKDHGEIDLTAFVQALHMQGVLGRAGGPSAMTDIYTYSPHPAGWSQWIGLVKEAEALRKAHRASYRLREAESGQDAIAEAEAALEAIRGAANSPRRSMTAKQAGKEFIAALLEDHEAGDIPGASTGIQELDSLSGGMRAGQLWVIGGQTSRGKSVLMLQIAAEHLQRGDRVAVFTLEMMAREVFGRLVCVAGRIKFESITKPSSASDKDLQAIQKAAGGLMDSELYLDPAETPTIESIRAEAMRIRDAAGKLDLVVVDYIQLVDGSKGKGETREGEIAKVSRGLKRLARELNCPVITASQLNEEGKTRESRAIVQDADALIYITEDGLRIGKLRNGQRDKVIPLYLDGSMQRFVANPGL